MSNLSFSTDNINMTLTRPQQDRYSIILNLPNCQYKRKPVDVELAFEYHEDRMLMFISSPTESGRLVEVSGTDYIALAEYAHAFPGGWFLGTFAALVSRFDKSPALRYKYKAGYEVVKYLDKHLDELTELNQHVGSFQPYAQLYEAIENGKAQSNVVKPINA